MKYHVLDLFSGIGGFSLGLERAGMETVAFCEIDPFAQRVLRKHWPNTPIFKDVNNLTQKSLSEVGIEDVSVITLGFPCQDISEANTCGKGLKGAKSGLWKQGLRLIAEIRPRWAIIENVPNIRSRGLVEVMQDLRKIGYDCEWHLISAASFGQSPIVRDRIWILAYPSSITRQRLLMGLMEKKGPTLGSDDQALSLNGSQRLTTMERGQETLPREATISRGILYQAFKNESERFTFWESLYQKLFSPWDDASFIPRISPRLPRKLDRLRRERIRQLGNTVMPQIPQMIGEAIIRFDQNLAA